MSVAVAITGMHRSGTSLAASLLADAGLSVGDRLVPANRHNPHGHFEDDAFVRLQQAMLERKGTTWTLDPPPASLEVDTDHRREAEALVASRAGGGGWGWKDPRTALFLDFWASIAPGLKVVFVFRRAELAVASLRRRGDAELRHRFRGAWPLARLGLPPFRGERAFAMWREYNRRGLEFAARRPEEVLFLDADRMAEGFPRLVRVMRESWGVGLRDVDPRSRIDPRLVRDRAPVDLVVRAMRPSIRAIHVELQRAAGEASR
jgi:hypothetical protein